MKYLPDGVQMQCADRYTIENLNVSSMVLMERAAQSCVAVMEQDKCDLSKVCIVCGGGNNGGDGFAIGRLLKERTYNATVCFVGKEGACTEETRQQIERYREIGGIIVNTYEPGEYSVILDAVFGVGLNRAITGQLSETLDAMNASTGKKIAVDIPSGISAATGQVLGTAFRADVTVTFQSVKLGLMLYPGHEYAGEIKTVDIGIETTIYEADTKVAYTMDRTDLTRLLPKRWGDSHKGTYGKVLIIAGSKGMAGAAYLSAYAAYMVGAGLVQIYTTEDNRAILQGILPEAIVTTYDLYDERELLRAIGWADVVSIGSGLGTSDKAKKILRTTLENVKAPCVVDADGLNLLSENKKYIESADPDNLIFTPHIKEMARLVGAEIREIKERRGEILSEFTDKYPVTCVLKDSRTLVGQKGKRTYVNVSGNAAMAKAGSGDVLAGVIAGLLAQGLSCLEASGAGVYLHGLAGDRAKWQKGSYSVLARDIIEQLSEVLKEQEEM